jgi:hypothetical protein
MTNGYSTIASIVTDNISLRTPRFPETVNWLATLITKLLDTSKVTVQTVKTMQLAEAKVMGVEA